MKPCAYVDMKPLLDGFHTQGNSLSRPRENGWGDAAELASHNLPGATLRPASVDHALSLEWLCAKNNRGGGRLALGVSVSRAPALHANLAALPPA